MEYKQATAAEAVLDFERHIYNDPDAPLFKGERHSKNVKYKWAYAIIMAARKGTVSAGRAHKLLEKYGGDRYDVKTSFGIMVDDNDPTFAELAADFREKHPGAFDEYHKSKGEL